MINPCVEVRIADLAMLSSNCDGTEAEPLSNLMSKSLLVIYNIKHLDGCLCASTIEEYNALALDIAKLIICSQIDCKTFQLLLILVGCPEFIRKAISSRG